MMKEYVQKLKAKVIFHTFLSSYTYIYIYTIGINLLSIYKLESDEWIIGRLEVILGQVRQNTAILHQFLSQGRSTAPVLNHEAIEID